jgi:plastocyanin
MNKILLVIIVLTVALGAFTFFGNKKSSPTATPSMKSQESSKAVATPNNPTVTVALKDSGFVPKDITVKAGTRVVWINKSGTATTVSSDDHPTHRLYPFLNLGEFADGSSVQVVVEKVGKYSYHNHLNASEAGTITAE